jgi:GTP pyrophosphokinase
MLTGTENAVRLAEAEQYGKTHLSTTLRGSGESYAVHGQEVARALSEATKDESLLAVAMLHDILTHSNGTTLLERAPLTNDERALVEGMQALRRLHIDANEDDLDLAIDAFAGDPRLLLLRMAHRYNDILHLDRFSKKRQRELCHETLHMYAAIAGRLSLQQWRRQMEDISFQTLQPRTAKKLSDMFRRYARVDAACMDQSRIVLQRAFKRADIDATVDGRIKSLYSTYRKMVLKKRQFAELTDRLALRIIAQTPSDCYRILGIVHETFHPIPDKLKDYIGTPKDNGYRSLHTVVYPLPGITELPIEIQIRTPAMHRECEFGFAAHVDYKEWMYSLRSPANRANLLRNIAGLRLNATTARAFERALRSSFSEGTVLVFDAADNPHHLAEKATAMDAICAIDPEHHTFTRAVKINGRTQPLDWPLKDGDTIEIVYGKRSLPLETRLRAAALESSRALLKKFAKPSMSRATLPA